jgi:hypothetical protein
VKVPFEVSRCSCVKNVVAPKSKGPQHVADSAALQWCHAMAGRMACQHMHTYASRVTAPAGQTSAGFATLCLLLLPWVLTLGVLFTGHDT